MNAKLVAVLNKDSAMNNKTYADLIKDHDYGWEIEPNLDELLLDYDDMIAEAYSLFGFDKVRYNKEHPHTVDLMTTDGTVYYAVYPIGVSTTYDEDKQSIKCTFTF